MEVFDAAPRVRPDSKQSVRRSARGILPNANERCIAWLTRALRVLLCVFLLVASPYAGALNRDASLLQLSHTQWAPKDGAPAGGVRGLAQTTDGYLWVASWSGLFKFDGITFEAVNLPRDPKLSSSNIFTICADDANGIWIGFLFGGIGHLVDGRLRMYTTDEGVPAGSVKAFAKQPDGVLWAGTSTGLTSFDGHQWHPHRVDEPFDVNALFLDSDATLWVGTLGKLLFLNSGDADLTALGTFKRWVSVGESATGDIWANDEDGLHYIRKTKFAGKTSRSSESILIDSDGTLWATYYRRPLMRLGRLDQSNGSYKSWNELRDVFQKTDGLSSDVGLFPKLEDREGNIWIGTAGGLDRFSERNVVPMPNPPQAPQSANNWERKGIAAGEQGTLWILDDLEGLTRYQHGEFTRFVDGSGISSASRIEPDGIWFAGQSGLWRYASGKLDHIAELPIQTNISAPPQALAEGRSGEVWMSITRHGVYRRYGGQWQAYGNLEALPRDTPITLASDANHRVWMGYTDNRVAMVDADRVQLFGTEQGLTIGNVTALYAARSGVYVGGAFGLARFDGSAFRELTPEIDGAFNNISGIAETPDGDLWLSGSAGIVHLSASFLRPDAKAPKSLHLEIFDATEGLEGTGANKLRPLPSLVLGTDQRLWAITTAGIFSITPDRIYRNARRPNVIITSLTSDGTPRSLDKDVSLPKYTKALNIHYAALSLTMPEKIRYRYKLNGVDKDWQEVQTRRAYYTNLAPGSYHFQVIASNNDGVWNETGATIDFLIPAAFIQTIWFKALGALLVAGFLAWIAHLRVHQVAHRTRLRLEERIGERERIARELHDTFLQSVQGLVIKFQAVMLRIPEHEIAHREMEQALRRADGVLAEGRDRVSQLRESTQPKGDLATALASAGEEYSKRSTAKFVINVEGEALMLHPVVQDEVYWIAAESIANSFHHAQSAIVEVSILYDRRVFCVAIVDDGNGFESTPPNKNSSSQHWGLAGMQERAARIHGQLFIKSKLGIGTAVELQVPSAIAYFSNAPRQNRFLGIFRKRPIGKVDDDTAG